MEAGGAPRNYYSRQPQAAARPCANPAAASAFDPVRAAAPAAAAGASNSPAKRRCPPASLVECGAGSSADLTDFSDADPPVARKATRAVSAMPPSPSEVRYEVSRLAVNMKDRRD